MVPSGYADYCIYNQKLPVLSAKEAQEGLTMSVIQEAGRTL